MAVGLNDPTSCSVDAQDVFSPFDSKLFAQYFPAAAGVNASAYLPAFLFEIDPEWRAMWLAFQAAVLGTYDFVRLWIVFLRLIAVPILNCLSVIIEALMPHLLTGAELALEYVKAMDPAHQAMTVGVLAAVGVCIRYGYVRRARLAYVAFCRSVKVRYRSFLASVSDKSKTAALLLPHVAFLVGAYASIYWLPTIVMDFWDNESLFTMLVVVIPVIRSIRAIRMRRLHLYREALLEVGEVGADGTRRNTRGSVRSVADAAALIATTQHHWRTYESCLKYWVLWSFVACSGGVMSLFIPSVIASLVTIPAYVCNLFLTWIHSPVTRGDLVLYKLLSPLFNPYANRLHDANEANEADNARQQHQEATNVVLRALVAFRVMPEHYVHFVSDLWAQGPALSGLMFIFTPGFVTARGCLLVAFGFPAYITMGTLAQQRTRSYEWWLLYFTVAVSVEYVITAIGAAFSWLPLFYHAKLLLMLWLQFPYFRGAQKMFESFFSSFFVLPEGMAKRDEARQQA
ncbi:TPA: hypothetical protein N0F65_000968 [Lagenidium giganteum]|uniref:Uncharacterized protein n=1 Tax=Lagenidium giganteum TaxID=4803 RepID=A0AAV2YUV4_9STRA|nr:TPA: hypothetical protein N0F65_000968 [Lagenidium giganteum]